MDIEEEQYGVQGGAVLAKFGQLSSLQFRDQSSKVITGMFYIHLVNRLEKV